jgi:ubiquinone/menaquinone biosynthesis C-methylase UbiE
MTARENFPVRYAAATYHRYTEAYTDPWDALLIQRVVEERRRRRRGGVLLDVGTGPAVLLLKLADQPALADLRFVGLDFYADMVAEARSAVRARGLTERIEIVRGDGHATGFPDESMDFVISRATIHHLEAPAAAYREIYRVLAPGGVAIVQDLRRDAPAEVVARFNGLRAEAGVPPTNLAEKYTVDEARAHLRAAELAAVASVATAESGPGSLGYEVLIRKSRA